MKALKPGIELNWLTRYLPLESVLDEQARRSLLEVGSGHVGLGSIFDSAFVGVDMSFQAAPQSPMLPFSYDGNRLPFVDGAFDTVVSIDTFEHVPPARRAGFIDELLRVSAAKVVLSFPADQAGRDVDQLMQRVLNNAGLGAPSWLNEHSEHGIPHSEELEAELSARAGWTWQSLPTTGSLACVLMTLADVMPPLRPWAQALAHQSPNELARWIAQGNFGPAFRKLYLLERVQAMRPKVELADLRTLLPALACPVCSGGGRLQQMDTGLACSHCHAVFPMDARGVVQLQTPAAPKATFYLEPDWLRDVQWVSTVHNFLRAFEADDAARLWLQVDPQRLPIEAAAAMLEPIHATFGAWAFAELVLSDDPREPPPATERIAIDETGMTVDVFRARFRAQSKLRSGNPL